MDSVDLSKSERSVSSPETKALSDRRFAAWLIAACLGVLLVMLVADRPLAAAAAGWPGWLVGPVEAFSGNVKGAYFILLAFAATLGSVVGLLAGPERTSGFFRESTIEAGFVLSATVLTLLAVTLLKFAAGRARPELLALYGPYAYFPFSTAKELTSFPSGETAMAAGFFGACAWLVRPWLGRAVAFAVFVPALAIAASRVIVGAHYPSDTLAAMVLALAIVGWLHGILLTRHVSAAEGLSRQRTRVRKAFNFA